jgi:hypothetical protein
MTNKKKFLGLVFLAMAFLLINNSASAADTLTATISQDKETTFVNSSGVGETFKITWGSTGATNCNITKTINGGASTNWNMGDAQQNPYGSNNASPTQIGKHVFTNSCTNGSGSKTASITHYVGSRTFVANQQKIPLGGKVVLTWTSKNTTECSITRKDGSNLGILESNGSKELTLSSSEWLDFKCKGESGKWDESAIRVYIEVACDPNKVAKIDTFKADPSEIISGGTSTLSWKTINTTRCKVLKRDGLGQAAYDDGGKTSATVGPNATADFNLTCWNDCGGYTENNPQVKETARIIVGAPMGDRVFSIFPTTVSPGKTVLISWKKPANVTSCKVVTLDGESDWRKDDLASEGSVETYKLQNNTKFVFSCVGSSPIKETIEVIVTGAGSSYDLPTGPDCVSKVCRGISCFNLSAWVPGTKTTDCGTGSAEFNVASIVSPGSAYLTWRSSGTKSIEAACGGPLILPRNPTYNSSDECLTKKGPECSRDGFKFDFVAGKSGVESCGFYPRLADGAPGTPFGTEVKVNSSTALTPTCSLTFSPNAIKVGEIANRSWNFEGGYTTSTKTFVQCNIINGGNKLDVTNTPSSGSWTTPVFTAPGTETCKIYFGESTTPACTSNVLTIAPRDATHAEVCQPKEPSCPSTVCESVYCNDGCGKKRGTKKGC